MICLSLVATTTLARAFSCSLLVLFPLSQSFRETPGLLATSFGVMDGNVYDGMPLSNF